MGGKSKGFKRDFIFDEGAFRNRVKEVAARGDITEETAKELDSRAMHELTEKRGDATGFESKIQELRGELEGAISGKGKFGVRRKLKERREILEDRPGQRAATLVSKKKNEELED
jgi:hypothetical protein